MIVTNKKCIKLTAFFALGLAFIAFGIGLAVYTLRSLDAEEKDLDYDKQIWSVTFLVSRHSKQ
jgi:hypothetical protein